MPYGAHAQTDEIDVDWLVEGQPVSPGDVRDAVSAADSANRTGAGDNAMIIIAEPASDADPSQGNDNNGSDNDNNERTNIIEYDQFVTGNSYAMGDYEISIFTPEGQLLNRVIIDQRDLQKDSFRHKIKYHDRFSDGYVELAEALLDPIGEQTYYIAGSKYDHNINSNLEIFVLERGYSLDDLQSVPNYIFSPMEFTFGRELLKDASLTGGGAGDLRKYSPNHMVFDKADLDAHMTQTFMQQTSQILEQSLFAPPEPESEPDLYTLTGSGTLSSDSSTTTPAPDVLMGTIHMQPEIGLFEDTARVRDAVERRAYNDPADVLHLTSTSGAPDLLQDKVVQYVMLITICMAAGLGAFWYMVSQRRHADATRHESSADSGAKGIAVAPTHGARQQAALADNYVEITRVMLSDAQGLYERGEHKRAHESLGRAIRFFYSCRLGAHYRGHMTNEDLLLQLWSQKNKTRDGVVPSGRGEYESVKRWLATCGSVEYARRRPDRNTFAGTVVEFLKVVDSAEPAGGA